MKLSKKILLVLCTFFIGINLVLAEDIDCSKTLKRGSTGNSVLQLQEKLNEYMDCDLEEDGVFGNKTHACVVKFQERYNLEEDGIVGNKTCQKLNSDIEIIEEEDINITDGNYIVITEDGANIRKGISTETKVVKTASLGEIYHYEDIININGSSWYKIDLEDGYGYINKVNVAKRFILVDISEQRLIYFKNKKVVLDTNVITGMKNTHDTPTGHYTLKLANKEQGRTLRGYNDDGSKYARYVDYWMPFITTRGIGFHDAGWRDESTFDDSTYIYKGSHGCVNMMPDDAKTLYNKLNKDTDVVVRK